MVIYLRLSLDPTDYNFGGRLAALLDEIPPQPMPAYQLTNVLLKSIINIGTHEVNAENSTQQADQPQGDQPQSDQPQVDSSSI